MKARDYFPLGIAESTAFCNREKETGLLLDNINSGKHCALIATRRYGKSSLALHAINKSGLPFVETDFYLATSQSDTAQFILDATANLIGKSLGAIEKLITSIKRHIKNLEPSLNVGGDFVKLELKTKTETTPANNVKEALSLAEKLLSEKKQRAVLLFDEFQNVGQIAKGSGIEAAIRHVAQKTKYLTIIFSGSNRRLLEDMFTDENRPLYKLCWIIHLQRIEASYYEKQLQKAAKNAWKHNLSDDHVLLILALSERHPFYFNKLGDRIFTLHQTKAPSTKDIQLAWQDILNEERNNIVKDIGELASGFKKITQYIANHAEQKLTSKEALFELKLTGSSVINGIKKLEEKDLIEKHDNQYRIIDPVLQHFLRSEKV